MQLKRNQKTTLGSLEAKQIPEKQTEVTLGSLEAKHPTGTVTLTVERFTNLTIGQISGFQKIMHSSLVPKESLLAHLSQGSRRPHHDNPMGHKRHPHRYEHVLLGTFNLDDPDRRKQTRIYK